MNPKVIAIGEILIDFVSKTPGPHEEAQSFKKCFGGAPMNTIVGVSRLGVSAGAIAGIGDDPFGRFLMKELERNKVDVSQVKVKKGRRTTISFVANKPASGERAFFFYRKPWTCETADSELEPGDVDPSYIANAEILHVSGFALSQNPCREAVFKAISYARKAGVKVSFDPTLRIDVWNSVAILRKTYNRALGLSDIATFSREEAEFMFGTSEPEEAARRASRYGIGVVGIKLGENGSYLASKGGGKVQTPAFKVEPVDTTGAGDGWNAGLLVGLCKNWDLPKCAIVANAIGALVVTKRGATTAMPYKEGLRAFLKRSGSGIRI
jgi:sugar/nucleoside kinase (ribokinase family)